jgi:hypothetical protein
MPCGAVAPISVLLSFGRGAGALADGVLAGVGVLVGVAVADRVAVGVADADVAGAGFLPAGGLLADVSAIRPRSARTLVAGVSGAAFPLAAGILPAGA